MLSRVNCIVRMIEINDGFIMSFNCCDKLFRFLREEIIKIGIFNFVFNKIFCLKINVIKEVLLDVF